MRRVRASTDPAAPAVRVGGRPAARVACLALLAALPLWGVLAVGGPAAGPAGAAVTPDCPPDCGFVAAGSPLLVPYMVINPGPGWLVSPASGVRSYAAALQRNLVRGSGAAPANVAVARWVWTGGRYQLLVVLVASDALGSEHLASPSHNVADLCAAAGGSLRGRPGGVAGVPGSVAVLCAYPRGSPEQGATLLSFRRGDVTALLQITSRAGPVDPRGAAQAAQEQYLSLPAGGVLVSNSGLDVPLVVLWLCGLGLAVWGLVTLRRRRGSWGAVAASARASVGRRWPALVVALVGVVGAMVFSMVDASLLHGNGQWYESAFDDFWRNWADAAYVTFGGGLGHLYGLDKTLETAPALQVLAAPVARAGFSLPFPYPSSIPYPGAYWLAGPLFLVPMVLPLCAGDRVMVRAGVTGTGRRLFVLAVMAVTLPPITLDGHPEDLVALGAMLYALVAAMDGRHPAAGWWLGAAMAFQFFAFLALPLALVFVPRRQWWPLLARTAVVPLALLAVPLAVDPAGTLGQLVHQKVYDANGFITPTWRLDPGVAAFLRAAVALAAVPAALLLARRRRGVRRDPTLAVVWVLGLLFALRVVEPELVPYFLAPALAVLPLAAARRPAWRLVLAGAGAVWLNWWLHDPVAARWSLWLLLVGQLAVLALVALPAPGATEPAPEPGPDAAPAPAPRRRARAVPAAT